ncbi:VWA domain containing CoxE-like protein [Pseudooceanicola marinus]|uniref:VWA domain containing CoxE-like protein n=1 Tax=Pseudooceanicola marinus TaxID=396013 RepID=A0A1X6ZDW0_9RHOB|nr:VWA domain-containing protein [Pseudooceanicola marinus]PJE28351.1 VWA domain-containing protein [Pseudooceanicola marinus]SLN48340.1 VWA domain containing CoxE-like protein [Pseudooceanicola marinus]
MSVAAPLDLPEHPRLVENLAHFARALRRAGLPVGPGQLIEAIRAVEATGFAEKRDFYWCLHACFVTRPEESRAFAQVFRLFWRDPRYMEHMMAMMLPSLRGVAEERAPQAAERRAAEALLADADRDLPPPQAQEEEQEVQIDARATASEEEKLRQLDFEQMSAEEMARARRMLAELALPVPPIRTRRLRAVAAGDRIDRRRLLRDAGRRGGEIHRLPRAAPRTRWPDLVVLCDISGSMSAYSRMVLHFLHAVANREGQGWAQVHAFTFGTRLTNITRQLRQRDVDAALAAAAGQARDWEGGTRIAESLHAFNRDWARRVLARGAVVLLITDGLDRDGAEGPDLGRETQRLRLMSRQLIWLNPLLRWQGFAPRAKGVAAMLPHVDSLRAGHSVASLQALAEALTRPGDDGEKARLLRSLG